MDNSLIIFTIALTAVIAGVIVWAGLRNRIPPELANMLAESVARLRAQLSARDAENIIRLYAGALYDRFVEEGSEVPNKVSRDFFVDFCVRAIMGAQAKGAEDAETMAMVVAP